MVNNLRNLTLRKIPFRSGSHLAPFPLQKLADGIDRFVIIDRFMMGAAQK